MLAERSPRPATSEETREADAVVARTAAGMGRSMRTDDVRELLLRNPEHPRWNEVARRCLTCTNCTIVCPTCFCTTEAPRGLLWHHYRLNADPTVAEARIVPPTSQNRGSIEGDLKGFVDAFLAEFPDLPDNDLRRRCAQTVRNYDRCISCATHFLRLQMDRQPW